MSLKSLFAPTTIIVLCVVASCSKSSSTNSPAPVPPIQTQNVPAAVWEPNADVYFVGTVTPPYPDNSPRATIWKNGVPVTLKNTLSGLDAEADAVAVNGTDVYVTGSAHIGTYDAACYWKNGTITKLADGDSHTTGIVISGSDVYISGYNDESAITWKNGVASILPPDSPNTVAQANGIAVVGTDVYMAGLIYDEIKKITIACYWKNGVVTKLSSSSTGSIANAIMVSGNDVYVTGFDNLGAATLWKNGTAMALEGGSSASEGLALAISGTDIYVAGLINGSPVYWKNGVKYMLAGGQPIGQHLCMAMSGNNIYIAGGLTSGSNVPQAIFWKNGTAAKFDTQIDAIYGMTVVAH